jgi:hypothetical protein
MNDIHPVHQTHDGFFNTSSNKKISLHNPSADMIDIHDIAHALSMICRFGGQTRQFYSVAQHSLLCCHLAPDELKFAALMHDTPKAYIHDIIKPLKRIIAPIYGEIEDKFEKVIMTKYQISDVDLKAIKIFDMQALEIEHKQLILGEGIELDGYVGCRPGLRWDVSRDFFIKAFWKHGPEKFNER